VQPLTIVALAVAIAIAIAALLALRPAPLRAMLEGADLAAVAAAIRLRFPDVPQTSPGELATWLADGSRVQPQLLDVREPDEYAVSHLPGAIQIDPGTSAAEVLARIDRSRPVVAYCSVGYRSSLVVQRLRAAGFAAATNLDGSIFAWANEGRPMENNGQRVGVVHPFDARFGLLLAPERRAW
jgi:rhodanese-related sulfurtransferase